MYCLKVNPLSFGPVLFVVLLLTVLRYAHSAPRDNSGLLYLQQYGYLSPRLSRNSSAIMDEKSLEKAIEEFQSFAGIEVTGQLDKETVKMMSIPRCGVRDKVGNSAGRSKRYALQGSRWKVKNLKYRVSKYPRGLDKAAVRKEIQRAFDVWTKYTDLSFTPVASGQIHIEISFETGEHGDGDPFDGPGGTLAHAYFPVFGGDAHFDASEKWTIDSYHGTNLFQVAAHEFGHSLGLSHSDVRDALMAPFYRGYDPIFELHEDDVQGIQRLYGKKSHHSDDPDEYDTKLVPKISPVPPTHSDNSLCSNPKLDAIFNSADGDTFVFQGSNYWKLTEESIAPGYPKLISQGWPGLPGNINAAFTFKNGKTYFFKGSKYWRYKGRKMDGSYPKEISEGFTGIPDDVDAAMVWSGNGKIYFYKGSKFWRFDPTQVPPVKKTYPKPISNWYGVPDNMDTAFQWTNGYTYFFKDKAYYRFNDKEFAIDATSPAFPRATAYWWFGCTNAPKGTIAAKGPSELGWYVDEESHLRNSDDDKYDSLDTDGLHNSIGSSGPDLNTDTSRSENSGTQAVPLFVLTIVTVLVSICHRL